ncbi:SDR family oxidoreductase [Nitrospirillum sp. BR 11163]|uniref:SDR family oxidoreductase n=1 Tax=Nitrospirillum sp. BR 11163 TaxID=3104323 RepID=UPI002AFF1626|nr:SDR family oxidoreductase [Nitrospirillum sp. BR 11163]MEA1672848.1 SDR family oxidoreductase [Nitrospirillum sp. BR 11163]
MSRVAIVTGASRGIGRATAIRLARDFEAVAIVARSADTLAETADIVRSAGAEPLALSRDLRTPEACASVIRATLERFGRIDALACIAGAVAQADLFALTDEQWDDGLALKFHSARRLTLSAWDALKASRGSVAITSGTSAYTPKASLAAVGTINAAIVALAKAFADSGIKDGVQVNSILPGSVMTGRRQTMLRGYADRHGLPLEAATEKFAAEMGIARYGEPDDIANAVAFLFAPESHWMTGTALRVDGGETKVV